MTPRPWCQRDVRDPLAVTFHLRTDGHVDATTVSVSVSKYYELPRFRVNANQKHCKLGLPELVRTRLNPTEWHGMQGVKPP